MVDGLPPLVVHEEVVDHGAQLGRQAGQEVDHAQPRDTDLGPGDVEREENQEAEEGDPMCVYVSKFIVQVKQASNTVLY